MTISHRLGHLIHYEHDPVLRDIVVLKPDWLAAAISFVFDDKQTRQTHGLVNFSRLSQLWNDPTREAESRYPPNLHPVFLRLMERFDLCYRVTGLPVKGQSDETSLIAQLVPDVRPDPVSGWTACAADGDEQQVQICRIVESGNGQSATAEGLFYQLIVRLHKYSLGRVNYENSVHWQRGLVVDDDYNGRALLEHIGNDVRITVRAPYPERFLSVLTREVKWLVESFWAGLRCEVVVPCVEPCGVNQPGQGLFEVQKLSAFKRQGVMKFPCFVSGCNQLQDIDSLLRNAPTVRKITDSRLRKEIQQIRIVREELDHAKPHVFLSYVHEDSSLVEKLFHLLTSRGIKVWYDKSALVAGQRWKRAIRTAIRQGSFFVACFSEAYSQRNMTYMNEELTLAIEELRKRPADQSWFIPVKLTPCSIPDRDIGSGETLEDLQHIELFKDFEDGIKRLLSVIEPILQASGDDKRKPATAGIDISISQTELNRFSNLDNALSRLMSQADDQFGSLMHLLNEEAKNGPRLFSLQPANRNFSYWSESSNRKFRLTLWCEHSRLPVPILNGKQDKRGLYELNLQRTWFIKAASFFKILTGTLNLVIPVASSAMNMMPGTTPYTRLEKELELGWKTVDSVLKKDRRHGESSLDLDAPVNLQSGEAGQAESSLDLDAPVNLQSGEAGQAWREILQQLHAWLKEQDPSFGGLVRVQNKRQEFLWVHPQFEKEY